MKKDNRRNLTTQMAYIAGFIDGEGCIRLKQSDRKGQRFYVTMHVTNADKKPLEKIQDIFGGKIYFQEKSKNKIIWQYYITCAEAADTLRALVGFLITKKSQAELAIYYQDNQDSLSGDEKHTLYVKMREMKKEINRGHHIHENPELLEDKDNE